MCVYAKNFLLCVSHSFHWALFPPMSIIDELSLKKKILMEKQILMEMHMSSP